MSWPRPQGLSHFTPAPHLPGTNQLGSGIPRGSAGSHELAGKSAPWHAGCTGPPPSACVAQASAPLSPSRSIRFYATS